MEDNEKLTSKDIRKRMENLTPEEKRKAWALFDKLGMDLTEGDASLTGTKPSRFTLQGECYAADHFRDIFLQVCEIAAAKHPDKHHLFFEIKGKKRTYFSSSPNDLSSDDFRRINGTNIYAELNENASTLKRRSEQVIVKFDLDPSSFKIF